MEKDGNLVIDFAKSLTFNILFWIGFIIAIVVFTLASNLFLAIE